jgi:hypothetical protein
MKKVDFQGTFAFVTVIHRVEVLHKWDQAPHDDLRAQAAWTFAKDRCGVYPLFLIEVRVGIWKAIFSHESQLADCDFSDDQFALKKVGFG